MSLLNDIREAMARMLREEGLDVVEVTDFEQTSGTHAWSDITFVNYTEVDISYTSSDGRSRLYTFSGDFTELIRKLSD